MFVSATLVFAFGCIILSFIYTRSQKLKKYPPGPFALPIIGNLLQLSAEAYCDFVKLTQIYGNIFSINLGPQKTVILNDYKDIKDAFAMQEFSGRPRFSHFYDPEDKLPKGISFSEGKDWEDQRRFLLKNLRDLGFGKVSMETMMHDEIKGLLDSLRKDVGKPICTNDRFNIASFNSLWTIMAGERFSDAKGNGHKLLHHMAEISKSDRSFGLLGFFVNYTKLMPKLTGFSDFMFNFLPIYKFLGETIESHKKTFQSGQSRDLLDRFLEQINKTEDANSSFHKKTGERNLQMVLYDLFFGGTETTSVTLSWTCLLMAHHPEVQEKLIAEIKTYIGESRLPSLSDRKNTIYIESVILEVLRYMTLVPLFIRRAISDVEFRGFLIPKGTAVYGNPYCTHQSKEIWGDPENFRPERFISKDGITLTNTQYILPFGFGKRVCPGESLARNQLYLFIASLFQTFRVSLDPNEVSPKIEFYKGTLLRLPKPHKLVLSEQ